MNKPLKRTSVIKKARAQERTAVAADALMPLDYMLAVIRDPSTPQLRRDRMAIAAAPYCHPRVAEAVKGKKVQQAEAAVTAGAGTVWGDDLAFEGRAN